jgi:flagellar basal-body rod protein FlgB
VPLFDLTHILLEQALVGSSARQRALAANLANANTPGYHRVDVDFHTTLERAMESGESAVQDSLDFSPKAEPSGPTRLDGSSIDMDREVAALTENGLEYQALVQIAKAHLKMIETAIGSRQ